MMSSSDKLNVLGCIVSLLILLRCSATNASGRLNEKLYFIMSFILFEFEIDKEWQGNWFPKKPGEMDPQLDDNIVSNEIDSSSTYKNRMKTMGITDPKCDDAEVIDNS